MLSYLTQFKHDFLFPTPVFVGKTSPIFRLDFLLLLPLQNCEKKAVTPLVLIYIYRYIHVLGHSYIYTHIVHKYGQIIKHCEIKCHSCSTYSYIHTCSFIHTFYEQHYLLSEVCPVNSFSLLRLLSPKASKNAAFPVSVTTFPSRNVE